MEPHRVSVTSADVTMILHIKENTCILESLCMCICVCWRFGGVGAGALGLGHCIIWCCVSKNSMKIIFFVSVYYFANFVTFFPTKIHFFHWLLTWQNSWVAIFDNNINPVAYFKQDYYNGSILPCYLHFSTLVLTLQLETFPCSSQTYLLQTTLISALYKQGTINTLLACIRNENLLQTCILMSFMFFCFFM